MEAMELKWVIYLLGFIASYFSLKPAKMALDGKGAIWTRGDRLFCLLCSLSSWVGVLTAIIMAGINHVSNYDKPAKW